MKKVSPTCTKGEEEGLVGVPLQQRRHAASHPLVALVDELLAEVAVDLLGCQPVVGRQRAVDEVRQLEARESQVVFFLALMVKIKSGAAQGFTLDVWKKEIKKGKTKGWTCWKVDWQTRPGACLSARLGQRWLFEARRQPDGKPSKCRRAAGPVQRHQGHWSQSARVISACRGTFSLKRSRRLMCLRARLSVCTRAVAELVEVPGHSSARV